MALQKFTIIHLSDLHFGAQLNDTAQITLEEIGKHKPDLIVISGDFTQIGSSDEFRQARTFIDALPAPVFCVPGNHDIARFNLIERFFSPYKKYKAFITNNMTPVFDNGFVRIAGINSARRALPHWNWANGAISAAQRQYLGNIFRPAPEKQTGKTWRICTFHHPVHKVQDMPLDVSVFGAQKTMDTLGALEIDLVLTGHVHHASITSVKNGAHCCVYLSASTALSSRLRIQENGFNVITLEEERMKIDIYALQGGVFKLKAQTN